MPKRGLRVEKLYAYVAKDEEGEGVIAHPMPNGSIAPMVGADTDRINSQFMLEYAQKVADLRGSPVHLVEFVVRKHIKTFYPTPPPPKPEPKKEEVEILATQPEGQA